MVSFSNNRRYTTTQNAIKSMDECMILSNEIQLPHLNKSKLASHWLWPCKSKVNIKEENIWINFAANKLAQPVSVSHHHNFGLFVTYTEREKTNMFTFS